jgi:DNA-binding transcriptional MocR family regulator
MMPTKHSRMEKVNLYERVAGRIAQLIDRGTLRPGERIPSVRGLSRQLKVSVTTVTEAYRLLEERGIITARPQSGYYVQPRYAGAGMEPEIPRQVGAPTRVNVGDLLMMLLRDARRPRLVQLGAALPNPELLPLHKLTRSLLAVARHQMADSNAYDFPPGCESLRFQIARRALSAGCALSPDQIVTTSGCQEAINLCLRAICRPGDTVAIETPTYYGILQALETQGLRALEIPTHPRDGIRLDALRVAIAEHPVRACIVVSNFSNPLGSQIPDDKKRELVQLLSEHEIPLIEDDLYGDLCFSWERPKVAKAFDQKELVLLCSSFSKTITPGYRVGWVAPGRFKAELERLKYVSNLATATLPQLVIADFLRNGGYDYHLRKARRAYARQITLMAQEVLRAFPRGTRVSNPSGGYVLWVELPGDLDSLRLYERALQSGITLAPGPLFSAQQAYRNCIRLTAGFWSPQVEAAVRTLGQLAASMIE